MHLLLPTETADTLTEAQDVPKAGVIQSVEQVCRHRYNVVSSQPFTLVKSFPGTYFASRVFVVEHSEEKGYGNSFLFSPC